MARDEEQIKRAADSIGEEISPEMMESMKGLAQTIMQTGTVPKEALGFNDEKMHEIYGQAYRLYNTGKYKEAVDLFRSLVILDATEVKYSLGLAACYHLMKEYEAAAKIYSIAGLIDATDPVPHFHASDCYIQMKDMVAALICLEMAVKKAGNRPEYQVLKDRALLTIESLKKVVI